MKTRKKYLLAKIEPSGSYGIDTTPAAADAMLTMDLEREIYGGNVIERNFDRSALGAYESINTGPMVTMGFGIEAAGSGTLGVVAGYGVLLRACGFSETIDAGINVEYDPISASYESASLYYDRDGERQISLGCRGTFSIELTVGQMPKITFSMTGLYAKPLTVTAITPVTTAFQDPLPVNNTNTGTCTIGAYALIVQSFSLDIGNEVPHLNLVNFEEVLITDRKMSGTMTVIAPTIAVEDLQLLVQSHLGTITTSAFQLIHAATPDIFQLDAPAMQLMSIVETDINGEQGYTIGFKLIPTSAGDDELKITLE